METVKIKRLSGFVRIPLSKYNERIHELYEDPFPTINPRTEVASAPRLIPRKKGGRPKGSKNKAKRKVKAK